MEISLKAARVNSKMEQSEVAEKMGITVNTLISWESGRTEPKISQARKLASIYNIPLDSIFMPSKSN